MKSARYRWSCRCECSRLVQEHEIEKIGAANTQKVNVRIIAATHRDLLARVAEGSAFREDLFYRLSVIPLELPPLREREGRHPRAGRGVFRAEPNANTTDRRCTCLRI